MTLSTIYARLTIDSGVYNAWEYLLSLTSLTTRLYLVASAPLNARHASKKLKTVNTPVIATIM